MKHVTEHTYLQHPLFSVWALKEIKQNGLWSTLIGRLPTPKNLTSTKNLRWKVMAQESDAMNNAFGHLAATVQGYGARWAHAPKIKKEQRIEILLWFSFVNKIWRLIFYKSDELYMFSFEFNFRNDLVHYICSILLGHAFIWCSRVIEYKISHQLEDQFSYSKTSSHPTSILFYSLGDRSRNQD